MIKILNDEKLEDLVSNGKCIVDFYADWCGPCKMLGSILEQMDDIDIVKVNVDAHPELASKYGVMSIPVLIAFENGVEKKKATGFMPEESIRKLFDL